MHQCYAQGDQAGDCYCKESASGADCSSAPCVAMTSSTCRKCDDGNTDPGDGCDNLCSIEWLYPRDVEQMPVGGSLQFSFKRQTIEWTVFHPIQQCICLARSVRRSQASTKCRTVAERLSTPPLLTKIILCNPISKP